MKSLILICALTIGSFVNYISAGDYDYQFMGTLELSDKSLITYKLRFFENDGIIDGEKITDFAGSHRTVSKIQGSLNKKNKTIEFKEVSNVATKSNQETQSFCYIHLPKGLLKLKNNKSIIQGHFYSSYGDGDSCVEGDIYLIGEEKIFEKMNRVSNSILINKEKKEKIKNDIAVVESLLKNDYLKVGESLQVNTFEQSVFIFIWDEQHEDNDKISISVNGKLYEECVVSKQKKSFKIDLGDEATEIEIMALNEGLAPPNTAKILIANKGIKIPVIAKLKEGEKAKIIINKSQ